MNSNCFEQYDPGYDLDLDKYVSRVWQGMEGFFHVLEHGDISMYILHILFLITILALTQILIRKPI